MGKLSKTQQKKMAAERAERKRAKNKRKKQARQERKRMEREFKEAPIRATVKSTLTALNPVNLVSSVYTMAVSLGTSMAGIGDISQTPQKKKISKLEKKLKKMEEKMEQLETTLPTVQHAQHAPSSAPCAPPVSGSVPVAPPPPPAPTGAPPAAPPPPPPSGAAPTPKKKKFVPPVGAFNLADIANVRLRKLTDEDKKKNPVQGGAGGFVISAQQLAGIKLRKASRTPKPAPRASDPPTPLLLAGIKLRKASQTPKPRKPSDSAAVPALAGFQLRKVNLDRSPGGTPYKKKQPKRDTSPVNPFAHMKRLRAASVTATKENSTPNHKRVKSNECQ